MNDVDYKAKLFEMIISGKGLQYVMDECSELLGNPFVFSNQSLQLVCKSSSCNLFPEVFNWIECNNEEKMRVAEEANSAGYFRDIYASDSPVCGNITGIQENWIAARVRLKNQVLGNILVADCQSAFTKESQELLPFICQTIAFTLQQINKPNNDYHKYAPLLIELLDGNLDDNYNDEIVRTHFKILNQMLPPKMRILIVRPNGLERTVNMSILDAQLSAQFPLSFGIIYKNDCVRILDGTLTNEAIEERSLRYMYRDYTTCGISRVFASTLSMHDGYLQADAAVRLNKKSTKGIIKYFDDVTGPFLLEQTVAANNMSAEGMILPEILPLLETSETSNSERLQDLAAYLSCGRNVTRAAELRKVHKNSMYYRLDRIIELTDLNLNDDDTCIQLIISLSLLGVLPFR
ncbi:MULTISPECIES: PucR family transcriptional regulator [Blautia]|uniref:PucR family transcriptional regulator n=1 Tax=Blautia TaxID=572511 RepID=UPI000BA31A95|nr:MULTISPECIES: helix-turn-helix domain-containing protein [Blautia]